MRPQARLRCVSWGERAPVALCREPTEAAAETKSFCPCQKPAETLRFCRLSFSMCCMVVVFALVQTAAFRIRFHLSSPAFIPSSTQNAPGFALFWLFRVRFLVFLSVGRAKFSAWFLCILSLNKSHQIICSDKRLP